MHRPIFILLLTCIMSTAQAQEAHLTFKGIPMEGTCVSFAETLKTKGFQLKSTQKDGSIRMTGSFAGRQNISTVLGPVSETTALIRTVTLSVPSATGSWSELTELFTFYKNHLSTKYGEPSSLSEKGTGEDYRCLADLKKGVCHYRALWSTDNGDILITLQYASPASCVLIVYSDRRACEMAEKEILEDL